MRKRGLSNDHPEIKMRISGHDRSLCFGGRGAGQGGGGVIIILGIYENKTGKRKPEGLIFVLKKTDSVDNGNGWRANQVQRLERMKRVKGRKN